MADLKFSKKKIRYETLASFGFTETENGYEYQTLIANGQFQMTVTIYNDGKAQSKVCDLLSGDEFVLHLVPTAVGSFVGRVREDYERVISAIEKSCTEPDIFKSEQTKELIEYVRNTYGDELEYLWQRFPDNAVWRRKGNEKWYAAVLTVSRRKLGLNSDEIVEIIDLRADKTKIDSIVDNKKFFPGWHMNKKSWYTVILDNSVSTNEIITRIDESYLLAK